MAFWRHFLEGSSNAENRPHTYQYIHTNTYKLIHTNWNIQTNTYNGQPAPCTPPHDGAKMGSKQVVSGHLEALFGGVTKCRNLTPSIHPYIHTSIHPYIHASIHPYIHTSIHPYIHPSIHPYIHASIHPYIHTYIHTDLIRPSHYITSFNWFEFCVISFSSM